VIDVSLYIRMHPVIPEGRVGKFRIVHETIPKGTVLRMYDPDEGRFYRDITTAPFRETLLVEEGKGVWMTDDPSSQEELMNVIPKARGRVLMCGLGIGLFPYMLTLYKRPVEEMVVVELSPEVIQLVAPHIQKVVPFPIYIVEGDAFEYMETTGERFDFVHVDIWGDITAPLREVERTKELAARCLKPGGECHVWLEELYRNVKWRLEMGPVIGRTEIVTEPCLICGKVLRADYAGLCMDCADGLGLSELFLPDEVLEGLKAGKGQAGACPPSHNPIGR